MSSKILFIFIILCSFDFIINYKISANITSIISDQKLKSGLPSPFTGKTFHKNKKTSEGKDELVCEDTGNGYCKKFPINSIYCGRIIQEGYSKKVECSTSDTPFLIKLDKLNILCQTVHVPGMDLYDLDTCQLKYSLGWNWLYTILIVAAFLIFSPCLICLVFYFGLMAYVKIFKRKKTVYNTFDNPNRV